MNRREALSAVSFLVGGTIIGTEAFLSGCSKPAATTQAGFLSTDEIALLDEVGETILPTTAASPGARAAEIGKFINSIVADCYSAEEQTIFKDGLTKLEDAGERKYDKKFMNLSADEKHDLLLGLDGEAANWSDTRKPEDPETHYYSMLKQLTIWGYFSSEIGATKALRHVAVPGRWEACVPLQPGDKAWG